MDDIIKRMFEEMKYKNITQKEIADMLEIGQSTVASWKKRNCPPPINYIEKISEVLGVSIEYLVTGSKNPTKYKLDSEEQRLIRLFRTASRKNKETILSVATGLNDKHLYEDIEADELLKTLL